MPFVFLTALTPSRCALIRMKQVADSHPSGAGRFSRLVTEAAERLVRRAIYLTLGAEPHRNFSDYLWVRSQGSRRCPLVTGPYATPCSAIRPYPNSPVSAGLLLIHSAQRARAVRDRMNQTVKSRGISAEISRNEKPRRSGVSSWSEWSDSNTRPPRPERGALPDCATLRDQRRFYRTAYLVAQAPNSKKPGEFLTVT